MKGLYGKKPVAKTSMAIGMSRLASVRSSVRGAIVTAAVRSEDVTGVLSACQVRISSSSSHCECVQYKHGDMQYSMVQDVVLGSHANMD